MDLHWKCASERHLQEYTPFHVPARAKIRTPAHLMDKIFSEENDSEACRTLVHGAINALSNAILLCAIYYSFVNAGLIKDHLRREGEEKKSGRIRIIQAFRNDVSCPCRDCFLYI
jgi:hypothetical protein